MSKRTAQIEPASLDAWRIGLNPNIDEALRRAREALFEGDSRMCFAALKPAMRAYGWEFHSDVKARRLWDAWHALANELSPLFRSCAAPDAEIGEVAQLFHKVYRAVHLDRDKRLRRNLPPSEL